MSGGRLAQLAVATFVALHSFVLVAGTAAADAARDRARSKLAEGAQLYDAGDFPAALKRYEDAYALVPSPKILYKTIAFTGHRRDFEALTTSSNGMPGTMIPACGVDEPKHGRVDQCATYYDEGQRALWLSVTGYAAAAVLGGVSLWLFTSNPHAPGGVAWGCATQGLGGTCRLVF
jgi:hypothetical protein